MTVIESVLVHVVIELLHRLRPNLLGVVQSNELALLVVLSNIVLLSGWTPHRYIDADALNALREGAKLCDRLSARKDRVHYSRAKMNAPRITKKNILPIQPQPDEAPLIVPPSLYVHVWWSSPESNWPQAGFNRVCNRYT